MFPVKTKIFSCALLAVFFLASLVAGCGGKSSPAAPKPVAVKAMKVLKRDTTLDSEYAGQVQGKNEVRVQARVSGNVVEKMVSGGQLVKKGQPLFKIDERIYRSALLSAQAQAAQVEANLANTAVDTQRYRELYKANAISQQQLATQESAERQQRALLNSNVALAQKAADDLDDTLVVSPIDGRLYVDDVSVGTYVQPGSTVLVTVGVIDPVFVQFSMSEPEYLNMHSTKNAIASGWGGNVTLTLSNGAAYASPGQVTQVDRGMVNNTGTLAIKATFANPNGVLIPGMFARVKITGATLKDAVLVPQRAVQQVLEKSYVMLVDENNKTKAQEVKLGKQTGSFWLVESGLKGDETVVVEGLTKVQEGVSLVPTVIKPEDLGLVLN